MMKMTFPNIASALGARVVSASSAFGSCAVESVIVSDLMSDVLTMEEPSPVIVSSLSSDQTIRAASMVDAPGVVIAQNKPMPDGMAGLAAELDVTLLHTPLSKFECCVRLGELLKG